MEYRKLWKDRGIQFGWSGRPINFQTTGGKIHMGVGNFRETDFSGRQGNSSAKVQGGRVSVTTKMVPVMIRGRQFFFSD